MEATTAKQGVVTLTAENLHGVPHGEVVVFTRDTDGPAPRASFSTPSACPTR